MESLSMQLIPVFDWLLWTTIQAAILFCLILLLQLILRGRLPIRWHYGLWLLLLIRMATPWLPESRISVFNLVPQSIHFRLMNPISTTTDSILQSKTVPCSTVAKGNDVKQPKPETAQETIPKPIREPKTQISDTPPTNRKDRTEAILLRFVRMLPSIWLVGALFTAGFIFAQNISLWLTIKRQRPITDQTILDLLENSKRQMRVRTIIDVVIADIVKSPALFGFIRPRLLLPKGMLETLGRVQLRHVFLHELAHLKRHDIYVGWLMSLLQVLHWFNPLIWLASYRIRADRELACDALVLARISSGELAQTHNSKSKDYGRTIISLLEILSRPQRLPAMAGILETKSQLKRRIKMIVKYKKTSRMRGAGAMLLLAVLACVVLTNAYQARADFTFGTPTNLGPVVNSSHGDADTSLSMDGLELYFDSDRPGGSGNWDLWVARRTTRSDDWTQPVNLGPTVNSSTWYHDPCISADKLCLLFASNRSGGYGGDDLWVTRRGTAHDAWGTPVNLGSEVNSANHEMDPAVSTDGLQLYFCSLNRPGGYGSHDIWLTTRMTTSDPWVEPVNLGPPVNTSYSDQAPSLSADGLVLVFRSDRPGGYGSGDLWMTRRQTIHDDWAEPMNLGPSVNSLHEDNDPDLFSDGSALLFTSNRPGGCGDWDIWQVSIIPIVDFNGDGIVECGDMCIMVDHWGEDYPLCDIGPMPWGDGVVDVQDSIVLAEHLFEDYRLIAHWKLDETEGSIAYDSAGEYNGDLQGNPVWLPAAGKADGALGFDGVDDYVSNPFVLNPADGAFSVFAWMSGGMPGQVIISQADHIIGRNVQLGSTWLGIDSSDGKLITTLMGPTFGQLKSEAVITDGQWHHVGLVYDFDALQRNLYVDGKEVAKDTEHVGGVESNGGLYFGASKTLDAAAFWSGLIDDIRIYDEALSSEEVAELAR